MGTDLTGIDLAAMLARLAGGNGTVQNGRLSVEGTAIRTDTDDASST